MSNTFGFGGDDSGFQFTPITLDLSILPSFFNAKIAQSITPPPDTSRNQVNTDRGPATVLPPWDFRVEQPSQDARLRQALTETSYIDRNDPIFDHETVPADLQKLFVLYKAVNTLAVLANEAAKSTTLSGQLPGLDQRFARGLSEVSEFVRTESFNELTLLLGKKTDDADSVTQTPRSSTSFSTGLIHAGVFTDPIAGINGDETFSITVKKSSGDLVANIDFANLAAGGATVDNIVALVNTELEAVGANTRFKRVRIDKDQFGIDIEGTLTETLSFSASGAAPAVYLGGAVGSGADENGQFLKLSGANDADPTRDFLKTVAPDGAETEVQSSAVDSQGNVYVVGKTTSDLDGQINQAVQDVFLTKYDSVGNLVFSRLLGADEVADGFSVAIDASDNVVVAGRVKGDLDQQAIGGGYDTFVTKFNSAGEEQFTRQIAPGADDGATGVAIAADGSIFVVGETKSALNSSVTHGGGTDGYLTKLAADGSLLFHRQFGGTGSEKATVVGIASDGNVIVTSIEDGQAIARKYSSADGLSAALWEVNLGDLQGGSLDALAIDGSSVYLAGGTGNASLDASGAASIVGAHSGGVDGFVVKLNDAGASATALSTTYLGTGSTDAIADVAVSGGNVYVAGYTNGALPGETLVGAQNGFAAKFDSALTHLWTYQYSKPGTTTAVRTLAVDGTGSSVLDHLGLPRGDLAYTGSTLLGANSTVRVGDRFAISVDGKPARTIRIEDGETLKSLALKVNLALTIFGKASVNISDGQDVLNIEAGKGRTVELIAGPEGRDALRGLGLPQGPLINDTDVETPEGELDPIIFGLGLDASLNLRNQTDAARAQTVLNDALAEIRDAYREYTRDPALDDLTSRLQAQGGQVSSRTLAQLANYQAGLARLTAGQPTTGGLF